MAISEKLYDAFRAAAGVSTDTRTLAPNDIFFALKGPNFNGNRYAAAAIGRGAALVVTDEPTNTPTDRTFRTPDALAALQQLARRYRQDLRVPTLAIGGSNGKTTTKELAAAVLSQRYRTFATPGNLNNHIGVPLTLLRTPADTELLVVEIGANAPGEIAFLCTLANPTHGLITNIGRDHLEGFGSVEGVARANGELFDYLKGNGGTAFINTQEPYLSELAEGLPNRVTYPTPTDKYAYRLLPSDFFVRVATPDGAEVETRLTGQYNFANVATALCVGAHFGVPADAARAAVAAYAPRNNRSQLLQTDHNVVLLDAYNANPSSMEAALRSLRTTRAARRAVVLGDMLEMGAESEREHRALGALLRELAFDRVLLCGPEMRYAHAEAPDSEHYASRDDLVAALQSTPLRDHCVLVKGSRGLGLEKVAEWL